MRLRASIFAIAVLTPLAAFAQTPPPAAPADGAEAAPAAPPPAAPAPAPEAAAAAPAPAAAPVVATAKTWKDLIVVEGLVDSYYMWNFSRSAGANSLEPPPPIRQFDLNSNSFTLNYAKVGVGMTSEKAGFRLDMGYGVTGAVVNSAVPPGAPAAGPGAATAFVVQQAYATLIPIEGLTIDFGKFVTTAGAEVIESNKNWLYSRSFLFFNIPLLHNGVRAGYKVNDMLSLQLSVVNGWNGQGLAPDINGMKTFGFNAAITLPQGIGILPTIYVGEELPGGTTRFLGDLVATYSMGPLGLNLNFDYLKDTSAMIDYFAGVSAMGHYVINDMVNGTLRFEFAQFAAPGAASNKYIGVTGGVSFPFSGHYELRPEIRADTSSPAAYGIPAGSKGTVVTGTLAALAYF